MEFLFTQTPLHYFVQSFWRDEAFSYLLAKKTIAEIIPLTARDFSPPFYYLILHIWINFFGKSEIALRSLSFIFYWVLVYGAYMFMRDIFKIPYKRSLLYLILFIGNPIFIYYAFEVRMYIMFAALSLFSYYAFYTKKKKLYIAVTIAGLFTHYFMVFVVFTHCIFMLLEKKTWRENLKMVIIPGLIFLSWLIYTFVKKPIAQEAFWILKPQVRDILYLPATLLTGYEKDFGFLQFTYGFIVPLLLISATFTLALFFGIRQGKEKDKPLLVYLLLWAFLPAVIIFIASWIKPLYLARYLIFSSAGILLIFIYALDHMNVRMRAVFFALLVLLLSGYQNMEVQKRTKADFSKTFKEIHALATPRDVIYVTSELDYHTAQYYFDEKRVFIYNKPYGEIPVYVGKVLIPEEAVVTAIPIYPQRAFIVDSYGTYTIKSAL